jgi:uncharacterized protein (TIRG00374 family)
LNGQRAFWLGLCASAVFLGAFAYLFLPREDIGRVFTDTDLIFVVPSLAFYFAAVWFRSQRWRFLLRPLLGRTRRALYPVVVAGYMANNILPVRLGEFVRAYYLGLREQVSSSAAFGTVVIERASDVLVLLFFVAVAWIVMPTSGLIDRLALSVPGGAPVLVVVSLAPFVVVGAIVLLITSAPRGASLAILVRVAGLLPVPASLKQRALVMAERLVDGLTVVRTPRKLATVLTISLPVWLLEGAMYLVIAYGFGIDDHFSGMPQLLAAVMMFTAIANLALIVPSASGGIGPFEFFGAATLVALGVPEGTAAIYALTVHVALLLPVTVLGAVLVLADGLSFRSLISRSIGAAAAKPAGRPTGPSGGASTTGGGST